MVAMVVLVVMLAMLHVAQAENNEQTACEASCERQLEACKAGCYGDAACEDQCEQDDKSGCLATECGIE